MKLNVGDYVRTKSGEIARIDECKGKDKVYKNMEHYETDRMVTKFNNFILYKEDILKSSPNIMDLIEVGDYVNGFRVECDDLLGEHIVIFESEERKYKRLYLNKIYIKSVLTHEQFESMQYNLESEVN